MLEVQVVDRIVKSEGLDIKIGLRPHIEDDVDESAITQRKKIREVSDALEREEPIPEMWQDQDTPVWEKSENGEWEPKRQESSPSEVDESADTGVFDVSSIEDEDS